MTAAQQEPGWLSPKNCEETSEVCVAHLMLPKWRNGGEPSHLRSQGSRSREETTRDSSCGERRLRLLCTNSGAHHHAVREEAAGESWMAGDGVGNGDRWRWWVERARDGGEVEQEGTRRGGEEEEEGGMGGRWDGVEGDRMRCRRGSSPVNMRI